MSRLNQKQIGNPGVGANLPRDIYHFLHKKPRDFRLQVSWCRNSSNAAVFCPWGCLRSGSLMSSEEMETTYWGNVEEDKQLLQESWELNLIPPSPILSQVNQVPSSLSTTWQSPCSQSWAMVLCHQEHLHLSCSELPQNLPELSSCVSQLYPLPCCHHFHICFPKCKFTLENLDSDLELLLFQTSSCF